MVRRLWSVWGKTKPDVVLLDIRMPVMDGRATLAEIRKQAQAGVAAGHRGHGFEQGRRRNGAAKPVQRLHSQALLAAYALSGAGAVSPKGVPGNGLECQNFGETINGHCHLLRPNKPLSGRNWLCELRRQEATEWPTLRDSLAVNETRAFAHKLFLLARRRNVARWTTYAATLTTFADAYAIGQMESHLAAFPELAARPSKPRCGPGLLNSQTHYLRQMNAALPETNTGCLLVVDDQESNIQVIGAALGQLGFEILPATGGVQAFRRLAVRRPDLILLDLLMPEMDGFEVCRRIRENPDWAEIPIIFLSSADDKGLIVRALESGGVDYITKPFNHAELVTRVRTHLALKKARDELKQLAEDRDELLGILTHDLKNHLGGMDMSAQLLRDRTEAMADPKLRLMAENISHSSSQMLAFVKEFLANASADHGLNLKPEPVNLPDAAARAVQQHQEAAQRKHLAL